MPVAKMSQASSKSARLLAETDKGLETRAGALDFEERSARVAVRPAELARRAQARDGFRARSGNAEPRNVIDVVAVE